MASAPSCSPPTRLIWSTTTAPIKLLGARHTTVVGNNFRAPTNYAVFIGAAGGEGVRVSEDILISGNNIIDLVTADQAGASIDYNVGIFITSSAICRTTSSSAATTWRSAPPAPTA